MAGRTAPKRTSRSGYKLRRQRYKSESHKEKNKDLRKLRHEINVEQQLTRTEVKDNIFNKVCVKFELDSHGKYALKRLIGTINTSRLTLVLENKLATQPWFQDRRETLSKNALSLIQSTKLSVFL